MKSLLNRGIVWVVVLTAHVLAQDAAGAQDSPTQKEEPSSTLAAGKSFDPVGKTSVVNWKLTCQQLCGEGFGGPACGLASLRQNTADESKRIKLDRKSQDAVCPTLCENGLGSKKCKCKPTSPPSVSHDHVAVCKAFCGATAKVQLSGCSPCEQEGPDLVTDSRSTTVPNTTPNWDDLCLVWCKMGEGGTVCNCDLPPFI
uniref:Putative conserved secreted protein n=1 Tax=Culex tarsalis TaxID=7177 RepID=A0A1Q3FRM6_CULTA